MFRRIIDKLYGPEWKVYGYSFHDSIERLQLTFRDRQLRTESQVRERLAITDQFVPTKIERG